MLVVHDENVTRLGRFFETHISPERFYVVEATYPHEITGPTLSSANKHHIMTKYSHRMTTESIKRFISGFDFSNIEFLT